MSMARRVTPSHPRGLRVPIADLNAEIRRRAWERRKDVLKRIGVFLFVCLLAFGLVLLAGRGSRR